MAFYIELTKINENKSIAEYIFESNGNSGQIQIRKDDGRVSEVKCIDGDDDGVLFERAAWALMKHWKKKEYPDKTCWAS